MSINKVILLGNVGQQPEVRSLQGGQRVASFRLATSERYKNKDGEVNELTEWHSCTAWGQQAELIEKYIGKGSRIYLEGKLRTRSYQDKSGATRYATEVIVDRIEFCGGGARQESQPAAGPGTRATSERVPDDRPSNEGEEDDLPF